MPAFIWRKTPAIVTITRMVTRLHTFQTALINTYMHTCSQMAPLGLCSNVTLSERPLLTTLHELFLSPASLCSSLFQ